MEDASPKEKSSNSQNIPIPLKKHVYLISGSICGAVFVIAIIVIGYLLYLEKQHSIVMSEKYTALEAKHSQTILTMDEQIASLSGELHELQIRDEYQTNIDLEEELVQIRDTYNQAVLTYEQLLKLKEQTKETDIFDKEFTTALLQLSKREYEGASTTLTTLSNKIGSEIAKIAQTFTIPVNVASSNTPPGSGFSRQQVSIDIGNYLIDLVAADVSTTHIYVDTASDGTCGNDCPTLPLATYVSRNGAFAGINGSYFCPASYPSCAGKTNSFDTLLMNKNKVYFNSDNNKYSTVPAVIFGNGWVRFVGQSLEWGRDTGIDSMIANQPLLVSGGNVVFGGDGDPKKGSKGSRSFVSNKGNTVYIGVVHNVTVAESARVLSALGMENALNLDSGGSTALWSSGYKAGPGRNIPNAILFVRK
ncbi:phosphodiester glycosidase family protein [Patescibacteria group bacterium]